MEKQLINEIETTAHELLKVVNNIPLDAFNQIPFEGSWTPGQVAEHLFLSASGILKAVNGNTELTQRDPHQMIAPLREAFLNFNIKMQSPDFIIPSDDPKDKQTLLQMTKDTWKGLASAAQTTDLTATCLDFEMPTVGHLTRSEWLSFAVVHTQRHIWQLKKISKVIAL
ncbi:DinB family protein [Flavitalea sp. BT771]|uniref:DinB family protein n=1 Tax=Flavitalea sp. BT771 TaxID=3063329 RepID=UPI0026E27330|nr:DinB family protein [Flavitalea sp. BT771]MDO6433688.1 DinB family protein [Flavitalea sp. BT771]MDV6222407.1 DinB family protein [Flavitalea sp. BT771]